MKTNFKWSPNYERVKLSKLRKSLLDPRYKLFMSTKSSAKTKGLENTLNIEDIVIPEYCPVFGYKLLKDGIEDNSPSVDRVDNSIGYIKENIRIISWRANKKKSDLTLL